MKIRKRSFNFIGIINVAWIFVRACQFIHKILNTFENPTTDECSTDMECELNEKCIYNPANSRYQCTCNQGFSMVDGQCIVADCSTNPSQCHLNAQCVSNREGGFKCACVTGYHGDGVNQCIEDHIGCTNCGKNAVCGYNKTGGNYACTCQPVIQ